ncbi:MAG: hypothetical protein FIB06_00670 [Betaproteobacteria bacterium]|nr:hypothetical protein [Betaproteobacteria bacterium]
MEIKDNAIRERISSCLHTLHCSDSDGALVWSKKVLDVDALRSDSVGLFWQLQNDGRREYLVIGGSPATIEHGLNVFGELDLAYCAGILIAAACKELACILPPYTAWQCRRIDVTGNFALPDAASVKQALRQLAVSDGGRRKASNDLRGGDSVYWNPSSDLVKGKAYHKGPQLRRLVRIGKLQCSDDLLNLSDRLLRFEHTRGARWFRRLAETGREWFDISASELVGFFMDFFGGVVSGVEVKDMERKELVDLIRQANGITEGQAEAAFTTYRNIRADGLDVVRGFMGRSTFFKHLKWLKAAHITASDLSTGNVIHFRPVRVVLAQPVGSWDEIRHAA